MKTGTYMGLDFESYKSIPAINKSSLDILHRSPAHYLYAQQHPRETTSALRLGSALHSLVLEPSEMKNRYLYADGISAHAKEAIRSSRSREEFSSRFLRKPKFDRRTKDGKQAAELWEQENAQALSVGAQSLSADEYDLVLQNLGKEILTPEEHAQVFAMAESVLSDVIASQVLSPETEVTAVWEKRGILCKARGDCVSRFRGRRIIADVKTADNASPEAFKRAAYEHRYHVQAAWYLDGFSEASLPADDFLFIVVEKHPPYTVVVYVAEPELIEAGRREYEADFATYEKCLSENSWPGYATQILSLDLPRWAR